jgi:hypothetical protein
MITPFNVSMLFMAVYWLQNPFLILSYPFLSNSISHSIVSYTSMAHALVIFFKLSLIEVNGWDLSYVRQTIDFPTVLNQIASRLEEAKKMIHIEPAAATHNDVFSRYATKLRRIKRWWDSKIARDSEGVPPLQNIGVTEVVDDFMGGQHGCFDEDFWEQIMRGWDTAQ